MGTIFREWVIGNNTKCLLSLILLGLFSSPQLLGVFYCSANLCMDHVRQTVRNGKCFIMMKITFSQINCLRHRATGCNSIGKKVKDNEKNGNVCFQTEAADNRDRERE